ncbi:hypothetical protein EOD08_38620, partial [Mesorhizobium sp. M6A.T.Ca.TU.002.02.2.1]
MTSPPHRKDATAIYASIAAGVTQFAVSRQAEEDAMRRRDMFRTVLAGTGTLLGLRAAQAAA